MCGHVLPESSIPKRPRGLDAAWCMSGASGGKAAPRSPAIMCFLANVILTAINPVHEEKKPNH